jgi:hypothetical protein
MSERSSEDPMAFSDDEAADETWREQEGRKQHYTNGHYDFDELWEDDDEPIPPRGWLLGNTFCRQFLSMLLADGGTGKTALRIAQYLSCATGRKLTNEHVFVRCRVLIICLEDSKDELRRRLRAARLCYNITADEIQGWLRLWTPKGIRLMDLDEKGRLVSGELQQQLHRQIKRHKIDLVGIDPLIKSHGAPENDNKAMDIIAGVLASTAHEYDCATDIVHHMRKGPGAPGNADAGRGASAIKDAARIVDTLTPMTEEEANLFGVGNQERKSLIRLDNAKVNLAPRATDARWFKIIGIDLGNGNEMYPRGDNIQTIEVWTPPDLFFGLSTDKLNAILDEIDRGMDDGGRYSHAPRARKRAAWKVICAHAPEKTEKQARAIITTWVRNEVFILEAYHDTERGEQVTGLRVNPTKRPGQETTIL